MRDVIRRSYRWGVSWVSSLPGPVRTAHPSRGVTDACYSHERYIPPNPDEETLPRIESVKQSMSCFGVYKRLLVVLLLGVLAVTARGRLGPLPLDSSRSSAAVRALERVVDVLLRVESDDERGDVDDLLADSDVSLSDEDSGVVDRLGESELEDLGLQPSLQEVLGLEGQDVVESHSRVVEHTDSHQSSDQRVSLEESLGVLVVELEELSGGTSDLRVSAVRRRSRWIGGLTLERVS